MTKYAKIHQCGLCGEAFATLPVTIYYSTAYHPKFCEACGKLIEDHIRYLKRMMNRSGWK